MDQRSVLIICVMRLPIALMALLVGAALALAGLEKQTLLNNPLASPHTLGISSAASFGAALSLVFNSVLFSQKLQNFRSASSIPDKSRHKSSSSTLKTFSFLVFIFT